MSDNKIVKWIMETNMRRWVLFLPLSIISAILCSLIWEFINRITMGKMISTDSFFYHIYNVPLSGIIAGFVFVYVGGYIAPHKDVKVFLLSIIIISSLLFLLGNIFLFESADYWSLLFSIFLVVGAFLGRNYLNNNSL